MIARAVVATSAPQSLTLADDDLGVLNAATEGAGKKQKKEVCISHHVTLHPHSVHTLVLHCFFPKKSL